MSIIQQAHEAVDLPEVQAMIKELGKFGLGVFSTSSSYRKRI